MSAVQKIEPISAPVQVTLTPMDMLAQAVERGMPVETIDKLMALADRWQTNQARMAFDAAVAAAKAEIPVIAKNRTGHNNKRYADLSAIAATVDPILGRHGLGYRFRTVQDEKTIRITCVLFHKDGHAEENTLCGPSDTTGNKNAIQAIGSTSTYLMRYSLVQALGLAAAEDADDDGRAAGSGETISDDQVDELRALLAKHKLSEPRFLASIKLESLTEIGKEKFEPAKARIIAAANRSAS